MKKYLLSFFTTATIIFASACSFADTQTTENQSSVATTVQESTMNEGATQTEYPLTVTDASGTEVTIEMEPERVVSASPSETEILFALGLGDKLVGVSDYDDYPEEALEKEKVGGVVDPNEEAILALEPDFVIGGISMSDDVVQKLRDLELPMYKNDASSLDEIMDNILQIGLIMNAQEEAKELVADMQTDIDEVREAVKDVSEEDKKTVYVEFAPGWTVGSGEFLDELITLAGGVNAAGDVEGWNEVNEEKIIEVNPDVIIYAKDAVDFETEEPLKDLIQQRGGWEKMTAIQEDRLVPIEENIVSRIGPRVTEALKQFAEAIYPELYTK